MSDTDEMGPMERYIIEEAKADRLYDGFHATALLDFARKQDQALTALERRAEAAEEHLALYTKALVQAEGELMNAKTLLRRISQWDHMDTAGDGAYWRSEIAAILTPLPQAETDAEAT